MAYRSATVPFSVGDAALGTPSRTPGATPAFFDFSVPIARAESWLTTSQDVIESTVAGLVSKERRLQNILTQTVATCEANGSGAPAVLVEAVKTFGAHAESLSALYPSYVFPLASTTDRLRLAIVNACCAVAAKLVSHRTSYPAKLYELYAAASEISIGYVALQATALSLGDRCAAAVAARHLRHVGELLLTLHELVPYEAVRDLQVRGLNASTDDLWEVAGITAAPSAA
ncbi:MAG: hypothetical protein H7Z40_20925 [Phycisphaerae bacterium]|nr:hypothetical protein [Gemmatimonadaceae bacterium]